MPSTVISSFEYDATTQTLQVKFRTGKIYNYLKVPVDVYEAMKNAFAKGSYFNDHIKDRYPFVKVH
jgi:hypothetical protein